MDGSAPIAASVESIPDATQVRGPNPGPGHSERVIITHIATPHKFYVQLTSRRGELATLERQINQYCRAPVSQKPMEGLIEGCLVIAQYSKNKQW